MLKDYIVISNNATEVSRISLEKLGFSTKRNDANTIGQFGSGVKYAPIAALRKGLEWFFTGYDKNGPFTLKYETEKEDGIECIVYKYDDYQKSSSFTLDAGVMSWETPFQILREPICNAMDSAKMEQDGWYNVSVITVDTDKPETMQKLEPKQGVFSVYITASPELMEIINNYDKYFTVQRTPRYTNQDQIIFNRYDSVSRFYTKNVLVKEDFDYQSVFDYQFNSLTLNEERTVKNFWDLEMEVMHFICKVEDEKVIKKYIQTFIKADSDSNIWELARLGNKTFEYYLNVETTNRWTDVWNEMGNEKAVILTADQAMSDGIKIAVVERGYTPIIVRHQTALNLFKALEFKFVVDILGESADFDINFNVSEFPNLVKAIDIASYFESELDDIRNAIAVFKSKKRGILGLVTTIDDGKKVILIDEEHAKHGPLPQLIGTLIHEFDHYTSGLPDASDIMARSFRDLADIRIGILMANFYKSKMFEHYDDGIRINHESMSALSSLKYKSEYSELLSAFIIDIGSIKCIVNAEKDAIQSSGTCLISEDGSSVYIPVSGDFTIMEGF